MTLVAAPTQGSETGPAFQFALTAAFLGLTGTVPASGQLQSAVLPSGGYQKVSIGLTSTQTGALNVQRFLDAAGAVKQGAAITAALTAATAAVANVNDGLPFASYQVTVTNTGGSPAALTAVAGLLQSA